MLKLCRSARHLYRLHACFKIVAPEHVGGAENGAERAEKLVSGSRAVSGTFENREERERSAEREIGERERNGERATSSHKFP
jgi:hypothetical protein